MLGLLGKLGSPVVNQDIYIIGHTCLCDRSQWYRPLLYTTSNASINFQILALLRVLYTIKDVCMSIARHNFMKHAELDQTCAAVIQHFLYQ